MPEKTEEVELELNGEDEQSEKVEKTQDFFREIFEEWIINESIVSVTLDGIKEYCHSHSTQLQQIKGLLLQVLECCRNQNNQVDYIKIVADCQKQTAELANNALERHALNPAIETVFVLTGLFHEIHQQTVTLRENQSCCPMFRPILDSIAEAVNLAEAKCQSLDIEKIAPADSEDFDPQRHEIGQTAISKDSDMHRKIERTLVPGLIYRGKVLRQAKVSVYRYVENQ